MTSPSLLWCGAVVRISTVPGAEPETSAIEQGEREREREREKKQ
jgi:hypothetical protein